MTAWYVIEDDVIVHVFSAAVHGEVSTFDRREILRKSYPNATAWLCKPWLADELRWYALPCKYAHMALWEPAKPPAVLQMARLLEIS